MSAKAGEAIAVDPKEGNPESKSSGFERKGRGRRSLPSATGRPLFRDRARMIWPFPLLFHSATVGAERQLFDDVSPCHPAISSAPISFCSVRNFSLRFMAIERFKWQSIVHVRARATTEIKARNSSPRFCNFQSKHRAVIRISVASSMKRTRISNRSRRRCSRSCRISRVIPWPRVFYPRL